MEKKLMKQEQLNGIPVLIWKGVPLICIEEDVYVTAEPIGSSIRAIEVAKRMARKFGDRYHCEATITNDIEWIKFVRILNKNAVTERFIQNNELNLAEVLLLNSDEKPKEYVFAGGADYDIDEIFYGYISDFDSGGREQAKKLLFLTLKPENPEVS